MKPVGPVGTIQDLNLREGDFVVCVDAVMRLNRFTTNKVYTYNGVGVKSDTGCIADSSISTFQRLHHHDPRCFGFEEKDMRGYDVEIYRKTETTHVGLYRECPATWSLCGVTLPNQYGVTNLIPLTPRTEFEVLGHRFATRKEAEDAMEIKEVVK